MASDLHTSVVQTYSLEEIHSTVPIPKHAWRRFLAFSGPAWLVSVGYMDPGNWGTDIEAGSEFRYRLLWVLLMSNVMALLLQSLATRLGVVTGRDLAQACRDGYPRRTSRLLWLLCEIAIAGCDLAEVIGTVIALKMLFGLDYLWGLLVAAGDTFLLLALQKRGVRLLELLTLGLIGVITVSFFIEIVLARPDWAELVRGLIPGLAPNSEASPNGFRDSLYVAIGMLGATVMPHNLYLHSALVQTRSFGQTAQGKRQACKYNLIDSTLALNGAFLVNAAILVLAAAKFAGREVETLQQAHELLPKVLAPAAAALFAVALLASGQSSTFTGTLAGQVVMEGFLRFRLRPWARRLLTRTLALTPALLVIALAGRATSPSAEASPPTATVAASSPAFEVVTTADETTAPVQAVDRRLLQLLVLSQVVLSFQLPFAIVPLVHFTSDRRWMGEFASGYWLKIMAWTSAAIVVGLNGVLIGSQMPKWAEGAAGYGWNPLWVYGTVGPLALGLAAFLGWIALYPVWARREEAGAPSLSPVLPGVRYRRIGVAVELEGREGAVLAQAAALARVHRAELVPIHVVEGFGAAYHGPATDAQESRSDRQRMAALTDHLQRDGFIAHGVLGYGEPADELVRIVQAESLDLLVLGTHGHRFLADLALGQTVSPLLHRLTIPVLVVPNRPTGDRKATGR